MRIHIYEKHSLPICRTHIIQPCVKKFMTAQGFASEAEVTEKGVAIIFLMPNSVVPLKDMLKDRHKLLSFVKKILGLKNESVTVLTELAQALLTGFLTEIREHHINGYSWNGQYDINDMMVVDNFECKITKQPYAYEEPGSSGQEKSQIPGASFQAMKKEDPFDRARAVDVKRLEQIFAPILLFDKKGKKLEGDAGPVFYESLQMDMSNVTPTQVKDERFWEYLLNHPALKPPILRSTFVILLRTLIEQPEHLSDQVKMILQEVMSVDWRLGVGRSDVLKEVYDYWTEEEKKKTEEKGTEEKGTRDKGVCRHPFERTHSGLVVYNRHFLQHANRIVKVFDTTQLEVFFSSRFRYLPGLMRRLLYTDGFRHGAW